MPYPLGHRGALTKWPSRLDCGHAAPPDAHTENRSLTLCRDELSATSEN